MSDREPKKALVVDDMTTVRLYHRQILEGVGFVVSEAGNGLEGLEKALASPFDLLLVDINMPKMDGYRLVRQLRREQVTRDVPVIIISTEAERHDREKAYQAGANAFLIKPVTPGELAELARLMAGGNGT